MSDEDKAGTVGERYAGYVSGWQSPPAEDAIVSRRKGVGIEGVQGKRVTPPPGWAVEGSHDGETWERLGEAGEAVDMGERRYARFVSERTDESCEFTPPAEPAASTDDLPGIISRRATLRLTRLELVTLLQRIAPDLPTSAGVEPDQDGGVRLSWDE